MREEGEAGCWSRLQRVAHEVAIEIEQRRKVRREERRADLMLAHRRLEADAHGRAAAAAEECFRSLLAAAGRSGGAAAAARCCAAATGGGLAVTVRVGRAEPAAALPVEQLQALAVEQHFKLFARHRAETCRRHVVAEDWRHGH